MFFSSSFLDKTLFRNLSMVAGSMVLLFTFLGTGFSSVEFSLRSLL